MSPFVQRRLDRGPQVFKVLAKHPQVLLLADLADLAVAWHEDIEVQLLDLFQRFDPFIGIVTCLLLPSIVIEPLVDNLAIPPLRDRHLLNMAGFAAGRDIVARGFIEGHVVADG